MKFIAGKNHTGFKVKFSYTSETPKTRFHLSTYLQEKLFQAVMEALGLLWMGNVSSDQAPWGAPLAEDARAPAAAGITEPAAVRAGGAAAAGAWGKSAHREGTKLTHSPLNGKRVHFSPGQRKVVYHPLKYFTSNSFKKY